MAEIIHRSKKRSRKTISATTNTPPQKPKQQEETIINRDKPKANYLHLAILAAITFLVFSPALHNDFTNWDDHPYVLNNPMLKTLDKATLKDIFFSDNPNRRYWMGNYHPLTMLSLNLTYQLYNDNGKPVARIFILINILLHVLNTILVYLVLLQLFRNRKLAFIAALLFGVHTLHVESVAWIAERKDVLYTFFYLWSLLFYVKYTDNKKASSYITAFILFVLSLLSKGQAVSLAITIILIDFVRGRKLNSKKVILEKIPFLVLALIFGLIAIEAQKHSSAIQEYNDYEFYKRIAVAGYGFVNYILKLILPVNLSALYPYPDIVYKTVPWYYWLYLIPSLAILYPLWKAYKKNDRIVLFSIAFFIINIFLLLQLIQVGGAMYADRYAYIPSIGFFTLVAYLWQKAEQKNKSIAIGLIALYIALLSAMTVDRIGVWRNSLSLWEDTVKKQPKSVVAWNNLGSEISNLAKKEKQNGNIEAFKKLSNKAIDDFTKAIEGKPDYSHAFYNRAVAKKELAEVTNDSTLWRESLKDLNSAISIELDFTEAFIQRGVVYEHYGQFAKAINDFNRVLELEPDNTKALINLGTIYGRQGKFEKAIEQFDRAIKIDPDLPEAYANKGLALYYMGKYTEAIDNFDKSLDIDTLDNFSAYYNRALAHSALGQMQEAIEDMTKALRISPDNVDAHYLRGQYFLELNMTQQACADFEKAAKQGHQPSIAALKKYCKQKK